MMKVRKVHQKLNVKMTNITCMYLVVGNKIYVNTKKSLQPIDICVD